ncbi:MAG: alkaline phosphatase family protein [Crocinitomicaceae bacterium]|nr:alkaline phosphatase family protein [Crocinitomicaceae bacterium]
MYIKYLNILILFLVLIGCRKDNPYKNLTTEYVIIVVIDGPRYSETWGDPNHTNIPYQSALTSQGVLFTNFLNTGVTSTTPGHTSILTGVNQTIDNNGLELPANPSLFQLWRKENSTAANKAWLICSKDKLAVLANCEDTDWNNQYMPSTNCGIGGLGLGTGYRDDSTTFAATLTILSEDHPNLTLINFREPDYSGHQANWNAYILGINQTDTYVAQLWEFIQNDPIYKNKTTLLITNDHGRHSPGVADEFVGHGDNCEGCQKLSLLALGPDFKGGRTVTKSYEQVDIASTVAYMLKFKLPKSEGEIMRELFE